MKLELVPEGRRKVVMGTYSLVIPSLQANKPVRWLAAVAPPHPMSLGRPAASPHPALTATLQKEDWLPLLGEAGVPAGKARVVLCLADEVDLACSHALTLAGSSQFRRWPVRVRRQFCP
jgi:hypothetical protein